MKTLRHSKEGMYVLDFALFKSEAVSLLGIYFGLATGILSIKIFLQVSESKA